MLGFLCGFSPILADIQVTYQDDSKLNLRVVTQAPEITVEKIRYQYFSKVSLSGATSKLRLGHPRLPSLSYLIVIPKGKKPILSQIKGSRVQLPLKYSLSYAAQIPNHCEKTAPVQKNKKAYWQVLGKNLVEIETTGFAASDRVAQLRFWPLKYSGPANKLAWAQEIDVEVKFVPDDQKAAPLVTSTALSLSKYWAVNADTSKDSSSDDLQKVDLIIAHSSHRETLARYIEFKRSLGREVREFYVENKTNKQIHEIIKQQYQLSAPPTGTLLVGNIDQIPSWGGSGDNRWTDFYFSVLDSDDYPDIALGRVPAHNSSELSAFIDKAIAREREPRQIEHILLTAGKDESLGCPANVTKVGGKIKAGMPEVQIIKKYKTEVSTGAIIDAYNQDPNLVIYDGHGNRQGMTEVPLVMSSLKDLKNRAYPIILDIACLNANWGSAANPRNFAESILLDPERGAAGIMASGGSGYGHDFFQTIGSIMGKASQSYRTDIKMNQIGQVILAAKIQHGKQDRTYWNYYGDPASSVWESTVN